MQYPHRVTLPATDLPSLQGFYADVFGWSVERPLDWYWSVQMPATASPPLQVALVDRSHLDTGPLLFITVDDLAKTMVLAQEKGATVLKERTSVQGMGYLSVLLDPQQNPIGLWQDDSGVE